MAKGKVSKPASVPNKNQHSRISFLYQAAAYLATHSQRVPIELPRAEEAAVGDPKLSASKTDDVHNVTKKHSQLILSDMRAVSQKMQIRLSPAMKHTVCKRCDTLLIDGTSSTSEVENKSRNGNKPWADVLVRTCMDCGCQRRFPLGAARQKRRPIREKEALSANTDSMNISPNS